MNCRNCNTKATKGDMYCSNCGCKLIEEKTDVLLVIVSVIFPLIGLIIYLVKRDDSPKTAKACGLGALIAFIIKFVISIITIIFIVNFMVMGFDKFVEYSKDFIEEHTIVFNTDDFDITLNEDFDKIINTEYIVSYKSDYMQINIRKDESEYPIEKYMEDLAASYDIVNVIHEYSGLKYLTYQREKDYNYIFVYNRENTYYIAEFTIADSETFMYESLVLRIANSIKFNS